MKKNKMTLYDKYGIRFTAIILGLAILCVAVVCAAVAILTKSTEKNDNSPDDGRPVIEETRGVWVPSVYNLTFPSKPDLSENELKAELDEILETVQNNSLNTIFFQVRPSCDALYKSNIFSVSSVLSTDGTLTLDCLEYLLSKAHEKGVAVYAWVNPLRATASKCDINELSPGSTAYKYKDYLVSYDGRLYFDVGIPEVRSLICEGIKEIAENYKVDGIVFDDYFYPYPVYETADDGTKTLAVFNDGETFEKYSNGESLADFRRSSVNSLIEEAHETVKAADGKIKFGVSPFGIWQNDNGENGGSFTKGAQSYADNYSDTLAWLEGGFVDFISPQLYWDMNSSAASYKVLAKWWCARVDEANKERSDGCEISLLISHGIYRYGDSFESGEITSQLEYASLLEGESYSGSVFYAYNALKSNENGVADEIISFYESKDGNTEKEETVKG